MPRELPAYHRQVAATNRAMTLEAAMGLFLEEGYDRASLARVAERAGVSKATLFKQFPTKAELFEATVLAAGGSAGVEAGIHPAPDRPASALSGPDLATIDLATMEPPTGDLRAGLVVLGRAYVELVTRPQMIALMRLVIAESARFPELRERTFDFGTLPVLAALARYLRAEHAAGSSAIDDPDLVSAQFLGMIASAIFWPRLVHGTWSITEEEQRRAIDEAALTIVSRCAVPGETMSRARA